MAVDGAGNVYVTGATFEEDNLNSGQIGDTILTIKYNASGLEQWRAYATGRAMALAIDKSGNVYVTGDGVTDPGNLYEGRDYQTIKYTPDGTEAWRARANATADLNNVAFAVAVDGNGNVYVTGTSNSNYVLPNHGAGGQLLTVKYDSSGVEQWRVASSPTESSGDAIVVDSTGNVYVAGVNFSFSSSQYLTIKYSSTGVEQWRTLVDSAGNHNYPRYPPSLALDGIGNVILAGTGGTSDNSSYLTVKYAANGTELWRALVDGGAQSALNTSRALAVDGGGNVYITGQNGQYINAYSYRYDTLTVKYASNGAELWRASGNLTPNPFTASADAVGLAIDLAGNAYVAAAQAQSGGGGDIVTIKYGPNGTEQWRTGTGSTYASPSALGLDSSGNIYIAGVIHGLNDDLLTLKYNPAGIEQWRGSEGLVIPPAFLGSAFTLNARPMAVGPAGDVRLIGESFKDTYPSRQSFTSKLDSNGVEQWRVAGDAAWSAVAVDTAGSAYVTGETVDAWPLEQYLTVKYDSSGVEKWRAYANGGTTYEYDLPTGIAVDSAGNACVTGTVYPVGVNVPSYLTIKYDQNGVEQWRASEASCLYLGAPKAIAVDALGNVLVTGSCSVDAVTWLYVTFKYDPNGAQLWRSTAFSMRTNPGGARALAVDGSGSAYVTGSGTNPASQSDDFMTIKYDANGNELWRAYGNVGQGRFGSFEPANVAADLKLDADSNVYVTGRRFNGSNFDYATIKYDTNGVEQWRAFANGAGNGDDRAYSLAVDGANVYVTGESFNGLWYDDMTIRYGAINGTEQWRRVRNNKDDDSAAYVIALLPGNSIYIAGDGVGPTTPPGILIEKLVDPIAVATLASSANPSLFGQPVILTARITGNLPSGTVDFRDGAARICSAVPLARDRITGLKQASCTTAALTVGAHSISAAYSGDANNAGTVSAPLTQTVTPPPPGVSLRSSLNPSPPNTSVTFTATVSGQAPTGSVTFIDGTTTLCLGVPLQGSGNAPTAACTAAGLVKGSHPITARYSGDVNNVAATSPVLTQVVKRIRR